MEEIKIEVSKDGYPAWIAIYQGEDTITMTHKEFLRFEHQLVEVRRQILCVLDRRDWHEFDPKLAGV